MSDGVCESSQTRHNILGSFELGLPTTPQLDNPRFLISEVHSASPSLNQGPGQHLIPGWVKERPSAALVHVLLIIIMFVSERRVIIGIVTTYSSPALSQLCRDYLGSYRIVRQRRRRQEPTYLHTRRRFASGLPGRHGVPTSEFYPSWHHVP